MVFALVAVVAVVLAYANGANDNFKGVATLFGSGATDYRRALTWATLTTLLGSLAAVFLSGALIKSFGGKGLIEDGVVAQPAFASAVALGGGLTILLATRMGMPISTTHGLIGAHFVSSGIVSFARGLNDTPKIAALLLLAPAFGARSSLVAVGLSIAVGGWVAARRVAETMSRRITTLNHGQGLTANVITGLIVIGASRLGLPVSTTHVSCGSLFGIGAATGGAQKKVIATILISWLMTLPMDGGLAALSYWAIRLLKT